MENGLNSEKLNKENSLLNQAFSIMTENDVKEYESQIQISRAITSKSDGLLYETAKNMPRKFLERIIDNHEKVKAAERKADIDPLTGALNRRAYDRKISEIDGNGSYSVLFFDGDEFKRVNDEQGHATGDDVLKKMFLLARSVTRENDIFRLGGEEFCAILPNTNAQGAKAVAEKIRESFMKNLKIGVDENGGYTLNGEHYFVGDCIRVVTGSFGVAEQNSNTSSNISPLERADIAGYVAKKEGRNRVEVYHSGMGEKVS